LGTILLIGFVFSLQVGAQQPAPGRKKSPSLSQDDVRPPAEAEPAETGKAEAVPGETAKNPPKADGKTSPEEAAWRERIAKARQRAKETERAADQSELKVTQLRNDLGTSGQTAKFRNETAAGLEDAGHRLADLRKEEREAVRDLEQLEEYGREKKYAEAEGPSPKAADGSANDDFYRQRYQKLTQSIEDADRKVQLFENRVRDLAQQILSTGGKNRGDNFYIMQLQQDRDDAQQKLEEARAARSKAHEDLDGLMEEARRNGVPPGTFR
jgi:chromosome segregation ATPase